MSVSNGQPANESIFNNAFISRLVDTSTIGKLDLLNAGSADVLDAQLVINALLTGQGNLQYTEENYVTNDDSHTTSIDNLDIKLRVIALLIETGIIQVRSYVDDAAFITDQGAPTGGNMYYNSTSGKIRYYNGVAAAFTNLGEPEFEQESPAGTVDGINTDFTLSNSPLSQESVVVSVNGLTKYITADFSITGTTLSFVTAPAAGSTVYVYYPKV